MATAQRDYYAILDISPTASEEEMRHAYRRLVKLWHPDRFRLAPEHLRQQAERRMRLLTEAYGTLSDPQQRGAYDQHFLPHDAAPPHPNGLRFTVPTTQVPGYQASPHSTVSQPGEHGAGIFLGLIFTLIALLGLSNVSRAANDVVLLILILVFLVGTALALMSFTNVELLLSLIVRPYPQAAYHHRYDDAAPEPTPFEAMVEEVLANLPYEFAARIENLVIFVEQEPGSALLRRLGAEPGTLLLGLYQGLPLTKQTTSQYNPTPERITLYEGPIERYSLHDPVRIKQQIRATLLHELAHHFGMDHDEMPHWVKA